MPADSTDPDDRVLIASREMHRARILCLKNPMRHAVTLVRALTDFGRLRMKGGDSNRAERLFREAEYLVAEDYPVPVEDLLNLVIQRARLCEETGRRSEAIDLYEDALDLAGRTEMNRSETIAAVHHSLATLLEKAERPNSSESHFKMALIILETVLGPNDPKVAAIYNNLGVLYCTENRLHLAERMFRRGLKIRQTIFGKDPGHPAVRQSWHNLASFYRKVGRDEDLKRCTDKIGETAGDGFEMAKLR